VTDEDMVMVPRKVVAFLRGEAPLDGSWFGDTFSGQGAYWWRKYLWDEVATPPSPSPDMDKDMIDG